MTLTKVHKRDGTYQEYDINKIADAIFKAAESCGGNDRATSMKLALQVDEALRNKDGGIPTVEEIQNMVEKVLIENRHAQVAKAYILYREKRSQAREANALIGATINLFDDYLQERDWKVKENANMQRSIAGLNNYVREAFTKNYWLNEVYPTEVREAHLSGAMHIHDLGFFGAYCVGWDLRSILVDGFTGVPGKVSSKPAKHLRSFLGQVVNATFTTQGETAGAQAWSSFDTYCAPFIRYDNLTYEQVKQAIQNAEDKKITKENYLPIGKWDPLPKSWQGAADACFAMLLDIITNAQIRINAELSERRRAGDMGAANTDAWKILLEDIVLETAYYGYGRRTLLELNQVLGLPDKQRGSVISMALSGINLFKNAAVRTRTSMNDFNYDYYAAKDYVKYIKKSNKK